LSEKNKRYIVLEVTDPATFHLNIEMGDLPSLDYALNMLEQAHRTLERQQWFGAEQEMMQQQMQRMAEAEFAKSIVGRKQ
jgi:hypothetical protein